MRKGEEDAEYTQLGIDMCKELHPSIKGVREWCLENKEGLLYGNTREDKNMRYVLAWMKRFAEIREFLSKPSVAFTLLVSLAGGAAWYFNFKGKQ